MGPPPRSRNRTLLFPQKSSLYEVAFTFYQNRFQFSKFVFKDYTQKHCFSPSPSKVSEIHYWKELNSTDTLSRPEVFLFLVLLKCIQWLKIKVYHMRNLCQVMCLWNQLWGASFCLSLKMQRLKMMKRYQRFGWMGLRRDSWVDTD